MAVKALVVDDEQLARDELCYLLDEVGEVEVVGQAGNGVEALGLIEDLKPDVVFLDVQMPGLGGFEVARQALARGTASEIVFVTAFDQYALEAFKVNAVDYLLKPVDPGRLEQAVQRARRRLAAGPSAGDRAAALANEDLERIVKLVAERQTRRGRSGRQGRRALVPGGCGRSNFRQSGRRYGDRSHYQLDRNVELSDA